MSTYTPYTWPVIDTAAVCALQDLASSGSLLLNGTFTSSDTPNQISFISNNFIQTILTCLYLQLKPISKNYS